MTQHQVIGKVGQTGVATGPHLHYEFRIDNKPMDPMSIDLPRSHPLTGKALSMMLMERQNWLVMAEMIDKKHNIIAGLMTGSSADGVDVCVCDFAQEDQLLLAKTIAYPNDLRLSYFR